MKTIGTCKDCKMWGKESYWREVGQVSRQCDCEKLESSEPIDGAQCSDPRERLLTMPDFGCIHWEPQDKPLITLEEHAEKSSKSWQEEIKAGERAVFGGYPKILPPTGIACPDCGLELVYSGEYFGIGPIINGVKCECGLRGKISSFTGTFERITS